ncbi:putative DNA binding domain-containing protein [Bifidobacterium eulemuris]|uniref:Putative DNA binding domain-containing protein n=1 Tax=Bifidobacterium eulemuris TaxID=1765219 RepID=A0A7L9SS91_9BIFI|nr:putative DNA binding domain-containing protein [Bifidobacterium eulemuris]
MADSTLYQLISGGKLADTDIEQLHESCRIEAKKAHDKLPESIWDTYSAFANSEGGLILLGITEDSRHQLHITGVADPDKLVRDFWNTVNDRSKVSATIITDQDVAIRHSERGDFIVINVPRASREDMPIYIGQDPFSTERHRGAFRRNNDGDYHCDREECRAMMRDSGDGPLDRRVLTDFNADSLSSSAISAYRRYFKQIRPAHPWRNLPDLDFLLRLEALARTQNGDIHPTVAGLLMFGHDHHITQEFPNYFLDYREELGGNRWDDRVTSGDGTWSGCLYDFWQLVYTKLRLAIPHPFLINNESRRMDENPMDTAVREALTNTLVHADYCGRRGTVIIRRPRVLEFSNPGRLRMSIEEVEQGGLSDTRNPTLMKMFFLVGIGEKAGSGFDTMREGCDFAGTSHPTLVASTQPDRVTLTLQYIAAPTDDRPSSESVEGPRWTLHSHLSKSEAEAFKHLMSRKELSTSELAEIMTLGNSRARDLLRSLVQDGLAEVIGNGRSTRYRLKTTEVSSPDGQAN